RRPGTALPGRPARVTGGGDARLFGRHGAQPEPPGGRSVAARSALPGPDEHGGAPVSDTEELIADALHDLAAQAVPARVAAGALWHAGQRRHRLGVLATSAAAGAIAAALVVALTVGGLGPGHRGGPAASAPAAPVWLRAPLVFAQVAAASRPPCAVHSAK